MHCPFSRFSGCTKKPPHARNFPLTLVFLDCAEFLPPSVASGKFRINPGGRSGWKLELVELLSSPILLNFLENFLKVTLGVIGSIVAGSSVPTSFLGLQACQHAAALQTRGERKIFSSSISEHT